MPKMLSSNPFKGIVGAKRYEAFREALLTALQNGPLTSGELGRSIGISSVSMSAYKKQTSKSKFRRAVESLIKEDLIYDYYDGIKHMWALTAKDTATSKDTITSATPSRGTVVSGTSVDSIFQTLKDVIQKDADEKAEAFYKYLVEGVQKKNDELEAKIKSLENKLREAENKLSFRSERLQETRKEEIIWGMCARCARQKYPRMNFNLLNGITVREENCPVCLKYNGIISLGDVEFAAGLAPRPY